mmetsp:Transcript_52204/g.59650  ORF Transcript_52204/g.59650 Transcript_52204/m.59650 type:complete len:200 (+) Transcript_52204:160-759(+)
MCVCVFFLRSNLEIGSLGRLCVGLFGGFRFIFHWFRLVSCCFCCSIFPFLLLSLFFLLLLVACFSFLSHSLLFGLSFFLLTLLFISIPQMSVGVCFDELDNGFFCSFLTLESHGSRFFGTGEDHDSGVFGNRIVFELILFDIELAKGKTRTLFVSFRHLGVNGVKGLAVSTPGGVEIHQHVFIAINDLLFEIISRDFRG